MLSVIGIGLEKQERVGIGLKKTTYCASLVARASFLSWQSLIKAGKCKRGVKHKSKPCLKTPTVAKYSSNILSFSNCRKYVTVSQNL